MTNRTPIHEEDLHAYVDGELPPPRRQEVEAWLATHPEDAARVAAWRAQAEAIRARYGAVVNEPVPSRLAVERLARAGSAWRRAAAAGVAFAFALGAAAGWFGHAVWEAPRPLAAVATEAVEAHRLYIAERRHPIEVQAGESHLIPWLSRRVGTSLPAPDLAAQGLRLLGGRLLPGLSGHAAALFMYESASGERFTLYCRRAKAPGSAPSYRDSGQVGSFSWAREETACVLSGPADRARLEGVAGSAYRQLEQRATRTGALTAD